MPRGFGNPVPSIIGNFSSGVSGAKDCNRPCYVIRCGRLMGSDENEPPELILALLDVNVDEDDGDYTVDLRNHFTDSDAITFAVDSNDNNTLVVASIDPDGYTLRLDFQENENGTANIVISADDGVNETPTTDTFLVTVNAVNDAPIVAVVIPDVVANEDDGNVEIDLRTYIQDVDDTLTYAVDSNSNPTLVTASIDVDGYTLILDLQENQNGSATIQVSGDDGVNAPATDTFLVTVSAVNDSPVLDNPISDYNVPANSFDDTLDLRTVFSDVDDTLTFAVDSNSNPGLLTASIDGDGYTLRLAYATETTGSASIVVSADDGVNAPVTDVFVVDVYTAFKAAQDHVADVFMTDPVTDYVFKPSTLDKVFSPDDDIDWTTVTIISDVSNGSTSINPTTGDVTYTPDSGYDGVDSFTWIVYDDNGEVLTAPATCKINVVDSLHKQAILNVGNWHNLWWMDETSGTTLNNVGTDGTDFTGISNMTAGGGTNIDGMPALTYDANNAIAILNQVTAPASFLTDGSYTITFTVQAPSAAWWNNGSSGTFVNFRQDDGGSVTNYIQVYKDGSNNIIFNAGMDGTSYYRSFDLSSASLNGTDPLMITIRSTATEALAVNRRVSYWINGVKRVEDTDEAVAPSATQFDIRVGDYSSAANGASISMFGCNTEALTDAQILELYDAANTYLYQSLRATFEDQGMLFGHALPNSWDSQSSIRKAIPGSHANIVSFENAGKLEYVWTDESTFVWDNADEIVTWLKAENMSMYGIQGIWHNTPTWIDNDLALYTGGSTAAIDRAKELMRAWFREFYTQYGDVLHTFVVANEWIGPNGPSYTMRTGTTWAGYYGSTEAGIRQMLVDAFEIAREEMPGVRLAITDYRVEKDGHPKGAKYLSEITTLLGMGAEIDVVGFQMHTRLGVTAVAWNMTVAELTDQINAFLALGVEVDLTEIDVHIGDEGGTETDQAALWYLLGSVAAAAGVTVSMLWNTDDDNSWLGSAAKGTLFDTSQVKKPLVFNEFARGASGN